MTPETSPKTFQDEQAIRTLIDTWMKASEAGDIDAVLGLMTDDVVFMVAGQEPFGKEAFAKGSRHAQGQYRMHGNSEIEEIAVMGDWAYARAHITMMMEPVKDARLIHRSGFAMSILRKGADGRWRIARDANMMTTDPA